MLQGTLHCFLPAPLGRDEEGASCVGFDKLIFTCWQVGWCTFGASIQVFKGAWVVWAFLVAVKAMLDDIKVHVKYTLVVARAVSLLIPRRVSSRRTLPKQEQCLQFKFLRQSSGSDLCMHDVWYIMYPAQQMYEELFEKVHNSCESQSARWFGRIFILFSRIYPGPLRSLSFNSARNIGQRTKYQLFRNLPSRVGYIFGRSTYKILHIKKNLILMMPSRSAVRRENKS